MIIRQHQKGDAASTAIHSPDGRYRYALTRDWAPGQKVLFVMLNPSTATEVQNDPTVERCERRARRWVSVALPSPTSLPFAPPIPA